MLGTEANLGFLYPRVSYEDHLPQSVPFCGPMVGTGALPFLGRAHVVVPATDTVGMLPHVALPKALSLLIPPFPEMYMYVCEEVLERYYLAPDRVKERKKKRLVVY